MNCPIGQSHLHLPFHDAEHLGPARALLEDYGTGRHVPKGLGVVEHARNLHQGPSAEYALYRRLAQGQITQGRVILVRQDLGQAARSVACCTDSPPVPTSPPLPAPAPGLVIPMLGRDVADSGRDQRTRLIAVLVSLLIDGFAVWWRSSWSG